MKIRKILDIADDCIVKYTASEEWVFTTDELIKFSDNLIQECAKAMEEEDSYYGSWMASVIRRHFDA